MKLTELFDMSEDRVVFASGHVLKKQDPDQLIDLVNRNFNTQTTTVDEAVVTGIKELIARKLTGMSENFLLMLVDQAKAHSVTLDREIHAALEEKIPGLI